MSEETRTNIARFTEIKDSVWEIGNKMEILYFLSTAIIIALDYCGEEDVEPDQLVPAMRSLRGCQRQFEIVRKRRRNFVVFRRGG